MPRQATLTIRGMLLDADAWHARNGHWPKATENNEWRRIDTALRRGLRGLAGGSSLAQLLAECRGVRNRKGSPPLTMSKIRAWAKAHKRRTGLWPNGMSGPVLDAPGETWKGVDSALQVGGRGLPGGSSLRQLLGPRKGILTIDGILAWAHSHFRKTRRWPNRRSGEVVGMPNENWNAIERALNVGTRGLPGGMTLAQLLRTNRRNQYADD